MQEWDSTSGATLGRENIHWNTHGFQKAILILVFSSIQVIFTVSKCQFLKVSFFANCLFHFTGKISSLPKVWPWAPFALSSGFYTPFWGIFSAYEQVATLPSDMSTSGFECRGWSTLAQLQGPLGAILGHSEIWTLLFMGSLIELGEIMFGLALWIQEVNTCIGQTCPKSFQEQKGHVVLVGSQSSLSIISFSLPFPPIFFFNW